MPRCPNGCLSSNRRKGLGNLSSLPGVGNGDTGGVAKGASLFSACFRFASSTVCVGEIAKGNGGLPRRSGAVTGRGGEVVRVGGKGTTDAGA